jgi:hypothetical protein
MLHPRPPPELLPLPDRPPELLPLPDPPPELLPELAPEDPEGAAHDPL